MQDKDSPSITSQLTDQVTRLVAMASAEGDRDSQGRSVPITLAEFLGVAVAMYSLEGGGVAMGTAEEEEGLKEALTSLALAKRPCDEHFLQRLGIGKGTFVT